jgi:pyruvate dehydrogenase E2 component (dihydrolipoamide acetyltransferase)
MAVEVIMPALGMAQDTGKVVRWLKAEGDAVSKGEPLLEVETDKVTVEIESPADGTLGPLLAAEEEEVPVGQAISHVLAPGEAAPERAASPALAAAAAPAAAAVPAVAPDAAAAEPVAAPASRRKLASPKARRIAAELGLDIESLAGSGPNGAVVAADVEAAEATNGAPAVAAPTPAAAPAPAGVPEVGTVWRVMAERTTQSWQSVPHFYLHRAVDASRLLSWRAVARTRPGGESITPTDLLVRVAAEALRRHPGVNASWRDGAVVASERVNVAIAVATEAGLVVPVIHDADTLALPEIAARRIEIVERARGGKLRPDDVSGGTFTISNLGMYGVDSFDAIVNAPQAAILAVGRIGERVVAVDSQPAVRPVLELSVSFDHRAVDGARGAEFLQTLGDLIEEPAGLIH